MMYVAIMVIILEVMKIVTMVIITINNYKDDGEDEDDDYNGEDATHHNSFITNIYIAPLKGYCSRPEHCFKRTALRLE